MVFWTPIFCVPQNISRTRKFLKCWAWFSKFTKYYLSAKNQVATCDNVFLTWSSKKFDIFSQRSHFHVMINISAKKIVMYF